MIDFSRAWALEALIDVINAVGKVSESATAYAIKGDTKRAEALNKVGTELNNILSQIEEIVNIE